MPRIVITGGGIVGLCTAMLLARDGHEVTVLERDGTAPPADPRDAWEQWERRGVNQFRMLHYFLPRFRHIVDRELPGLSTQVEAIGGLRWNPLSDVPDAVTGGPREGDDDHEVITGRRPVVESVVVAMAASTPGLDVRRGVAVEGLRTGAAAITGVPHVTGVRTSDGTDLAADLVVDMTGRRSPLPAWLETIGARPPIEEREDSGFVYYGRHFRSADGSVPASIGPLLQAYGSISTLSLPADNGTWGLGIIASAKDAPLRAVREPDTWMRTVRSLPLVAHWADGEPFDDKVDVMAKIEDRCRRFVVDGTPVATGVVAVSDSWACTNPSLGRGMSMGIMHAVALRDLLRTDAMDDQTTLPLVWDDVTERVVMPWYRSTLQFDRHRLAEIDAFIDGVAYEPDDLAWEATKAMMCAAALDGDVLRGFLSIMSLFSSAEEVFADEAFAEKVFSLGGGWRDSEPLGPDREQLLATIAS